MHWQGRGARELSFTAGGNVNWKKEFGKEIFSTEIEDAQPCRFRVYFLGAGAPAGAGLCAAFSTVTTVASGFPAQCRWGHLGTPGLWA